MARLAGRGGRDPPGANATARAWRMLTGVGYQAGSLSPEQVSRVEMLSCAVLPLHPSWGGAMPVL